MSGFSNNIDDTIKSPKYPVFSSKIELDLFLIFKKMIDRKSNIKNSKIFLKYFKTVNLA